MVKPIGLRSTAMIRQALDLSILGMGGINTWQDAAEYISLGADAVEICTSVMLNGYGRIKSLKKGILEDIECVILL
jgi:dihydropyrimidine dehydrogenase (NAD+) subunit PreA